MNPNIKVTRTKNSRINNVDFGNLAFGKTFSDHMFVADYVDGVWTNFEIVPFGPFEIHPACLALHYGQAIFEGMKASKTKDGKPALFRPELHAQRINASARRLLMPEFPEDIFVEALHQLVGIDSAWIPPTEGSALYIRPYMFANGEFIGVGSSDKFKMIIFTGPVGPYYPKPVRLLVEEKYVRATEGGVGEAKAAGNYAASLLPAKLAKEKGYDQVLWMDGKEFKYIQEAGTMNLFFVIGDKVITPATDGAILKGITRSTIIQLLKDKGIVVEERKLSIDEVVEAHKAGALKEVFGSGTAVVVALVSEVRYRDFSMELPPITDDSIAVTIKKQINGIRFGVMEDKNNWVVPVETKVSV